MTVPTKRLPMLPVERALKVIAGRWKAIILYHLFDGPKRLSALQRLVPEISRKMLAAQLREMEAHGVVRRKAQSGIPARVDYAATPLGFTLEPLLVALCEWGLHHAVAQDELDRLADCPLVAAARAQRAHQVAG